AGAPSLDMSVLDALSAEMGADFLAQLIAVFLEDTPKVLADLRQALESSDAGALARAAHTLKSNATNMGAVPLADLSSELEELGRRGVRAAAGERAGEVEKEHRRVEAALRARGE